MTTDELDKLEPTPKAQFKAGKAVGMGLLALSLVGVTTFQSCQKQAELEGAIDAQTQGKVQAVLDYLGQTAGEKLPAPVADANAQQGQPAQPTYTVSVVEQKAEARNANLDTTIEQLVTLVQQTNCTRVQHYLTLAKSASSEQGISQEDFLLQHFNRTMQEMEAYALQVGYASDAGAIAATRSAFQEPLAVATALRAVYDGKEPSCRPDALPAVTAGRESYRDALAVRQMRREQIMNESTTVVDAVPEGTPLPADPAQSVPVTTTTEAMQP